jgi:hypothetical protein
MCIMCELNRLVDAMQQAEPDIPNCYNDEQARHVMKQIVLINLNEMKARLKEKQGDVRQAGFIRASADIRIADVLTTGKPYQFQSQADLQLLELTLNDIIGLVEAA